MACLIQKILNGVRPDLVCLYFGGFCEAKTFLTMQKKTPTMSRKKNYRQQEPRKLVKILREASFFLKER